MNQFEWQKKFLEAVSGSCNEGRQAVDYIRRHKTHIGLKRARKSVGAFWTLTRSAYLNSAHHSQEAALISPHAWSLLIHEVRHLQQGWLMAFSIYGELDAWQYQFLVIKKITGKQLAPKLEEILTLPLNMDRENLRHAQKLMTEYAGKSYGANWLPLYPIHKEIRYWLAGRSD
jgi:hypothetical protein